MLDRSAVIGAQQPGWKPYRDSSRQRKFELEAKIGKKEIKTAHEDFADYTGKPNDYEGGCEYFKNRFLEVNKSTNKQIFTHITCATDKGIVQAVFNACNETILQENLKGTGFML